jgi:hypothetical protein
MTESEGFFPERRLLAYRRSLLSAEPTPASPVRQSSSVWWILVVCLGPSYFSIWVSMSPRLIPNGHLPPILFFGSYLLVASVLIVSVLGMFLGIYRGLRMRKPSDQAPRNIL